MKVLTLTQPWATLVAIGAKKIETRSWETMYRGPLAIHAAKGFPKPAQELCFTEPFLSALAVTMVGQGKYRPDQLPRGMIVAIGELFDCRSTEEARPGKRGWFAHVNNKPVYWELTDQERAFGDYTPGRYAWLLANVRPLPAPIPAKGALGLWTIDDVVIEAALKGRS